ncbi:MAG: alpha/beta family hydrolase [Nitriliruptoraceae bacterium]
MPTIRRLAVEAGAVTSVTAAIHEPVRGTSADGLVVDDPPAVLLVPGAGGTLATPGLVALAEMLAALGATVVRANLPYREAGRRTPPRAEASVNHFTQILASADEAVGGAGRWVIGGKSYGGRVASMAVADELGDAALQGAGPQGGGLHTAVLEADGLDSAGPRVVGLLCYGYPLHPPGRPDRLRVDHWPRITVPGLFLQGDRDPFCDLDLLRAHLPDMAGPATLHVVDGGDHSLRIPRAASSTGAVVSESEVVASLAPMAAAWLSDLAAAGLA